MTFQSEKQLERTIFKKIAWGLQRDAFETPVGKSLIKAYSLGARDPEILSLIEEQVHSLEIQEALGTAVPFRKPRTANEGICLGLDLWGEKVLLRKDALTAGLAICGNSGSAKSTLLSTLAPQVAAFGASVWLSDMYKKQLRHLRPAFRALGSDLIVLEPRRWKWNLLQAGKRDLGGHVSIVVDVLVRVLHLPSRSRSILRQGVHELYQRFGIWDGKKDAWPCLFDLYEWVKEKQRLNAASRDAILDRLGALLLSLTPECAAHRVAWDPADLQRHSIVFELRGATETVKQILCESTLFSVFQEEVERGVVNAPLSLFAAFEDAQRFMDNSQEGDGEISPMEELAGIVRGTGKGLCIVSQTTHGLSKKLTCNLATKIMGRVGSGEEYTRLGSDLGMNRRQIEWAKRNLKPGTFISQFADGSWREPFVLQVPHLKVPVSVTDFEVGESAKLLDSLPSVPATEYQKWNPYSTVRVNTPGLDKGEPTERLTEVELRFLEAVTSEPGKPSSFYSKKTGISGKRSSEIRSRLASLGRLREHEVATGNRGRSSIILEPLPKQTTVEGGVRS